MNLQTSLSERVRIPAEAQAFGSLHQRVQGLIRNELSWRRLHKIQQQAIGPVLAANRDVLIIAGTASGKTEAAWFPILSSLLTTPVAGLGVLSVSPLKALIDDQVKRLARYGRSLDLPIDGWHGDISASRKNRVLETPPAGLIITPESMQGLLLNRRTELSAVVKSLRYVVIDEVHAFAGTDRGKQVQALLLQLEDLAGHRVARIALSATVSVPSLVQDYLRPGEGSRVVVVKATGASVQLDVEVASFDQIGPRHDRKNPKTADLANVLHPRDAASRDRWEIAREIDQATRGKRALCFAGSRLAVEEMSVLLADPEVTGTMRAHRFFAHHGSLSRELRRSAEAAMHELPDAVTVCTSTLELGVDLPNLDLVAQVDTCLSVAGLRQRLGRSGRTEGSRPTLRCYVAEPGEPSGLVEPLRMDLIQTVASVELIVREDWVEPADMADLGLSTLVHQVVALLADGSGLTAAQVFDVLCQRGPWRQVTAAMFAMMLRGLAAQEILRQDGRGVLLLDEAGLAMVGQRNFLVVFNTTAEYSLRHGGKELGTLPVSYPLALGSTVAFGGRLWQVEAVHRSGWVVDVVPATAGLPPKFKGGFGQVHAKVREEMHRIYGDRDVPSYLNARAVKHLAEGREQFAEFALSTSPWHEQDGRTLVALWTGDRQLATIKRWAELRHPGLQPVPVRIGLLLQGSESQTRSAFEHLLATVPTGEELSAGVIGKSRAKYDHLLPNELLVAEHASRTFDVPGAVSVLEHLAASG